MLSISIPISPLTEPFKGNLGLSQGKPTDVAWRFGKTLGGFGRSSSSKTSLGKEELPGSDYLGTLNEGRLVVYRGLTGGYLGI